jgi:hypothetical protein
MRRNRFRLSYANVTATLALFIALGGVSWAAATLPKNSVGGRQLKRNAVTGAKVKNRSLSAGDFKTGTLTVGPRGVKGDRGATGPNGPTGPAGAPSGARAFGQVKSTDPPTLVPGATGFTVTRSPTLTGVYCVHTNFTPKAAVASSDDGTAQTNVDPVGVSGVIAAGTCPVGTTVVIAAESRSGTPAFTDVNLIVG